MKNRKQYLTVTETTDKAFIALETENLTIPTWKIDYVIEKLNGIMDLVVNVGDEVEPYLKPFIPGLEKIAIYNEIGTISIVLVSNGDRVRGALYYGEAKDCMVDMFNSVDKI